MAEEQVQDAAETTVTLDSLIDEAFAGDAQVRDDVSTDTADADTGADEADTAPETDVEGDDDRSTTDTEVITDYAEAVRRVESQLGKPIADLIRGRQADFSRAQNEAQAVVQETRAMQQELRTVLAELQGAIEEEDTAVQEPELPASVTPEHVALFRQLLGVEGPKWAKDNGWVRKDDVEGIVDGKAAEREAVWARINAHQGAARTAVTTYGGAFGAITDGRFVLNENAKARMSPVLDRLGGKDFKGTLKDVFEMTYSPEELLAFKATAKPAAPATPNSRTERLRKAASVDTTTTAANGRPSIYKKGDKFEDVFDRAWGLSKQEIGAKRR